MSSQKFFGCKHCENVAVLVKNAGIPLSCCGEKLQEILPNTIEASEEKHIPAVKVSGDTVTVQIGSVIHPMVEEHHIEFIYLQTKNGGQLKSLKPGMEPIVVFQVVDDTPLEVFAYCNIHGMWKINI